MFVINDARKLMKMRVTIHKDGYVLATLVTITQLREELREGKNFFEGVLTAFCLRMLGTMVLSISTGQ